MKHKDNDGAGDVEFEVKPSRHGKTVCKVIPGEDGFRVSCSLVRPDRPQRQKRNEQGAVEESKEVDVPARASKSRAPPTRRNPPARYQPEDLEDEDPELEEEDEELDDEDLEDDEEVDDE